MQLKPSSVQLYIHLYKIERQEVIPGGRQEEREELTHSC